MTFEDYSSNELTSIFTKFCSDNQYEPDEKCKNAASSLFQLVHSERNETFGNARYVRNVFEEAVTRQSERLAVVAAQQINRSELTRLDAEDLPLKETLFEIGKKHGFLSMNQFKAVLLGDTSDEQLRQFLGSLAQLGIQVVSEEEAANFRKQIADRKK